MADQQETASQTTESQGSQAGQQQSNQNDGRSNQGEQTTTEGTQAKETGSTTKRTLSAEDTALLKELEIPESFDFDTFMSTLRKQRTNETAAISARRAAEDAAKTARDEAEALKKAAMTDEERKAAELKEVSEKAQKLDLSEAEWKRERQGYELKVAVLSQAPKLGVIDPDAALALVDRKLITFDDTGAPEKASITTALTALLKEKPYLKATTTQSSGSAMGGGARSQQDALNKEGNKERREGLFGRSTSFFDVDRAREAGGGVYEPHIPSIHEE